MIITYWKHLIGKCRTVLGYALHVKFFSLNYLIITMHLNNRFTVSFDKRGAAYIYEKHRIKGHFMEQMELQEFPFDTQVWFMRKCVFDLRNNSYWFMISLCNITIEWFHYRFLRQLLVFLVYKFARKIRSLRYHKQGNQPFSRSVNMMDGSYYGELW